MASNNEGYWSRSWAMLTRDDGWIKPVLVLAAAKLVPIVGSFGVDGYALEWARLTAWGVDAAPKQSKVNVSACIGSGARAFVVMLGYGFALGLLRTLLTTVLGAGLGGILATALGIVVGVVIIVAKLRATIYQSIGAGYQVERISDMVKRDYQGLLRIAGLSAVLGIAVAVVASVLIGGTLVGRMGGVIGELIEYERYGYVDEYYLATLMLKGLADAMPLLFVSSYVIGIGSVIVKLILTTSVGLWMRQFDVPNWGESSDPLPGTVPASGNETREYGAGGYHAGGYAAPTAAPVTDVPVPTPEPAPAPTPEPLSADVPMPTPEPAPVPADEAPLTLSPVVPMPEPETPEPAVPSEPVAAPSEVLTPAPAPAPEPAPAPAPEPNPAPAYVPTPTSAADETLMDEAAAYAASQMQEEANSPVELFSLQDAANETAEPDTFDQLVETLVERADMAEEAQASEMPEKDDREGERVISAIPLTPRFDDEEAPEGE